MFYFKRSPKTKILYAYVFQDVDILNKAYAADDIYIDI